MINQRFRRQTEHEIVNEQLSMFLDDQLSSADKSRVQAHLQTCESCREDLRSLRWTRRLLLETPPVKIPRSFVIREADVAPARAARRRPWFAMQWATAVVAMLLIVVLAGDLLAGHAARGAGEQPMPMLARQQAPATMEAEVEQAVPAESAKRAGESETLTAPATEAQAPSPKGGGGLPEPSGTPMLQVQVEQGETAPTAAAAEAATVEVPARKAAPDEKTDLATGAPPQLAAPLVESTPEAEGTGEVALMTVPETAESENASTLTPGPEPLTTYGEPTVPFVPGIPTLEPQRTGWAGIGEPTWRVVEIALGVALAGLLIATIWIKRQSA